MDASQLRAALFLWLSFLLYVHADQKNIFVSPSGNDSLGCGSKDRPCQSLDYAMSIAVGHSFNSTQIIAAKGNYTLSKSYSLTNVNDFTLIGSGLAPDEVQVTCETNVSLSFVLSQNIVFEGVKFHKCGGWHNSSVRAEKPYRGSGTKFKTGLDFRYCRNLRLTNVHISFSPGLGANLYDIGGVVNFTNCIFTDNAAVAKGSNRSRRNSSRDEDFVHSGGGVYMILNLYGYNTVNVTPREHDSYQHNNTYIFKNCHFLRNKALWSNISSMRDLEISRPSQFSRGGGLAIFFRGNASGCTIGIQSCKFVENYAQWGGGIQIEFNDETEDNIFTMRDTSFIDNVGLLAGGGARLGNLLRKGVKLQTNNFYINNCAFVNNSALWGGGSSLYGTSILRECATDAPIEQFSFNSCLWRGNQGTIGAGMGAFLFNQNEDQIGPEMPYHVRFNHCAFLQNEVVELEEDVTIGEGTLYSVQVPLIFQGNATFTNNSNTALALDGSTIEIYDHVDFIGNRAYRGGGIAMYGRSRVVLYENSKLLFQGNTCEDKGGAMYIYAPGPPLVDFNATGENTHICFFGYANPSLDFDDWKTKVVFQDNQANVSGNSVYATTLKNCRRAGAPRQNNSVLRWNFVTFESLRGNSTLLKGQVATDPIQIVYNRREWEVSPTELFNVTVKLIDEVGNSVYGIVSIAIKSEEDSLVQLLNLSPLFLTNGTIPFLRLGGKPGDRFSVTLNYLGRQLLGETVSGLTLRDCKPGFIANGSECACLDFKEEGIESCDIDGKTVYLKNGYWAGRVGSEAFVTHFCPTGYCNFTSETKTPSKNKYISSGICNSDRDQLSVLCGKCKQGYSVLLGTETCSSRCTDWYLLMLILYGLILLVVVMAVMLINLDFFTGYLNAWLYSYQVMNLLVPDGFKFDPFIKFLIGVSNFQIKAGSNGICFAEGLDDADKLAVMYIPPTYILFVVMVLSKVVSAYPDWCFSRRVKGPFRAFCTIFVLCYTDITRISLKILHPAKVGNRIVLHPNGAIEFFTGKHVAYGILAILYIVIFVLPFPLILMFRPCLTKSLWPVLNLNRWKPIFDALQSCFKDEYRWCAAFYFLCRLVLLIIHTFVPSGPVKRAVLEGVCILILLIFAYLRPYKEARDVKEDEENYEWINKSDTALLTTLTFIAVLSSPTVHNISNDAQTAFTVCVYILAYFPLVILAAVAYRVTRKCLQNRRNMRELEAADNHSISGEMSETYLEQGAVNNRPI